MKILGLDIGGAHIKYAVAGRGHIDRLPKRRTIPFELYKTPHRLASTLFKLVADIKPTHIALTMTGELCDIFKNRVAGVEWIIEQAQLACDNIPLYIFTVEGKFIRPPLSADLAVLIASANWAATANWVARRLDTAFIVDMGSTTTDILPIKLSKLAIKGKTDFERSRHGELVYRGYLRTHPLAVTDSVRLKNRDTPLCPELFAIMGDAHLVLGEIGRTAYSTSTPDGGPKSARGAMARLSRLILADPGQLKEREIKSVARQIIEAHATKLVESIESLSVNRGLGCADIIFMGPGKIYLKRLKRQLDNRFIREIQNSPVERLDPASCVASLLLSDV